MIKPSYSLINHVSGFRSDVAGVYNVFKYQLTLLLYRVEAAISDNDEIIACFDKVAKDWEVGDAEKLIACLAKAWLQAVKLSNDCSEDEMMAFLDKVFHGWYVLVVAVLDESDPDDPDWFELASAERGDLAPLRQKYSRFPEFINFKKGQRGKTRRQVREQALLEGFNLDYRQRKHRAIEAAYQAAQIRRIWKECGIKGYPRSSEWFAAKSMLVYCIENGKDALDDDGKPVPDEDAVESLQKAIAKSTGRPTRDLSPLEAVPDQFGPYPAALK
jgi:hypothetical protein